MCVTGHVLDLDSFTILEREADWRGSYLLETGGSRVKQEWWIALCLVPGVGQTPLGQTCTSQQT